MPEEAKSGIRIRDFPGLVLQAEPQDLPNGGAMEQVNVNSSKTGALQVRQGFRFVQFET